MSYLMSSDTITSGEVLDNLSETIAPTTIIVVDTQYDSEDNHSDNNDGQDVKVLSGDDQSIDNSTNSTPAYTSVDSTNETQVPNVQMEVDFSNWLNTKHTDHMETSVNENEGSEDNVEGHHIVTRHKAKQMSITHTSLAAEKLIMEPTTVKQTLASPYCMKQCKKKLRLCTKTRLGP
ncbi:hypothetical protein R3W88_011347 [Solanum pinnatisectum]|uniref:Uncharacterized protein n=1 Tax=Solanum pinnatisectum TaxID=50273 RepID=A0AAV9L8G9_9SOLN|nr:hypothetical protein R3W88_011347 [Solanum pinnatisectum]